MLVEPLVQQMFKSQMGMFLLAEIQQKNLQRKDA